MSNIFITKKAGEKEMRVKVGEKIYDGKEEPVMVILSKEDKDNIVGMPPELTKYAAYPDDVPREEIKKFMMWTPEQGYRVKRLDSETNCPDDNCNNGMCHIGHAEVLKDNSDGSTMSIEIFRCPICGIMCGYEDSLCEFKKVEVIPDENQKKEPGPPDGSGTIQTDKDTNE